MEERTDHDSVDGPEESGRPAREDLDRIVPEVTPSGDESASSVPSEPAGTSAEGETAVSATSPAEEPVETPSALPEEGEGTAVPGDAATDETTDDTTPPTDETSDAAETPDDAPDESAESLDDIAVAGSEEDEEALPRQDASATAPGDDTPGAPVAKGRVPWWPFLVYLVAWIALIAAAFYLISYEPDAPPAFQQDDYPYILLGGLVLTVTGPVLALIVWFVTWLRTDKGKRGGLLTSALLKGAIVTIFGVLAWWGTIVLLDALILGLIGPIS